MVVNPKGGSGKSTVVCNLLGAYAARGSKAVLIDQDRQGSATHWLSQRPAGQPAIHGIAAYGRTPANMTRSYALRIPANCDLIVVDTAAALSRHQLLEAVRNADKILMPVLPSDIDMYAASQCVSDLLIHARVPRDRQMFGVVANRVRRNTASYRALVRFLDSLGLPVVAELRDVQTYPRAAESGLAVYELKGAEAAAERRQWQAMMRWIDNDTQPQWRSGDASAGAAGTPAASPPTKRKRSRGGLKVVGQS